MHEIRVDYVIPSVKQHDHVHGTCMEFTRTIVVFLFNMFYLERFRGYLIREFLDVLFRCFFSDIAWQIRGENLILCGLSLTPK